MISSPIAQPANGARYRIGAGSVAAAATTMVCSIAPYCSRIPTVSAIEDCFWPMATYHARRDPLHGAGRRRSDRALAVDRLTEGVDHPADHRVADRDRGDLAG